MSDIEDDELLLQVAGRSKPSARSLGKKRKRRSISISEDDDHDSEGSEDGELDEEFEETMAPRSRGASDKGRKVQKTQEEKEVNISRNFYSREIHKQTGLMQVQHFSLQDNGCDIVFLSDAGRVRWRI